MKNYVIEFVKGDSIKVTAKEAAGITAAWLRGDNAIIYRGMAFASHQLSKVRPDKNFERDFLQGETPPRIEDFLSNKKLLT